MHRLMQLVCALSLGGCALTQPVPIARWHMDHNEDIAQSERQMIVQNILRARDQESMVFTRVSEVQGSSRRTISGTLGADLGEGPSNDTLSPGVGIEQSTNPSWTIGVLSSQEFTQGVLRPIDMDTVNYYVTQGWPGELFGYLFVESIELNRPTADSHYAPEILSYCQSREQGAQRVCVIENEPGSPGFDAFQAWVSQITNGRLCRRPSVAVAPYRQTADNLEHLMKLYDRSDLSLEPTASGGYELRAQGRFDICIGDDDARFYDLLGPGTERSDVGRDPAHRLGVVQLRSLQGAIYYLGEGLRNQGHDGGFHVRVGRNSAIGGGPACAEGCLISLMDLHSSPGGYGAIRVTHHQRDYYVNYQDRSGGDPPPTPTRDRSQMTINLMLQLLGLYQSSADRPTTGLVRVIN